MQDHFEESYIGKLWYIVLGKDKRSFNEYFSEEYGFTLNDDITDDQLSYLVIKLIVNRLNSETEINKLFEIRSLKENFRKAN
jgi:regulator of sirC expression with transglutaminase-like and TPR domain|tara:strand:- start:201 stop:446 length:246 start_codon:yes stop_codon:yes gene_type:complete